MSERAKVVISLLVVYFIWGSTYLGIQIALEAMPPLFMAASRFLLAGLVLLVVLQRQGVPLPTARQWRHALLVGGLMLAGGVGGVTLSIVHVASGLAAIMIGAVPLWATLLGVLFFGNRPNRVELLALLIGFCGVILLNLDGNLRANPTGALFLIGAAASWSLGSLLSTRLELPDGAMAFAAEMIGGALVLGAVSVALGEAWPTALTARALWAWLYLALGGSLAGYSAYMYLLRTVPVSLATSYAYVNPIVAVFLGIALASEPISPLAIGAMVIILLSVVVLTQARRRGAVLARVRG